MQGLQEEMPARVPATMPPARGVEGGMQLSLGQRVWRSQARGLAQVGGIPWEPGGMVAYSLPPWSPSLVGEDGRMGGVLAALPPMGGVGVGVTSVEGEVLTEDHFFVPRVVVGAPTSTPPLPHCPVPSLSRQRQQHRR